MTIKTVAVGLAAAFLAVAENKDFIIDEVEGLGRIGLKRLSLEDRDAWVAAENDSIPIIIKGSVCDPETGELSLKELNNDQIKKIPGHIADELLKKIYKHNGIKTMAEINAEREAGKEPEQLKN
ncbi:hypothetical protein KTH70_07330 [Acinetobacter baumannii]|nr:hypothetical protein [Acinetobacter baumannii]